MKNKESKESLLNSWTISYFFLSIFLFISPFIFSGDWTWNLGWFFTIVLILGTFANRIIANLVHPGLERERLTAGILKDIKKWDKWLVAMMATGLPILISAIAGLDKRLEWSVPLPNWINWTGLTIMILGFALGTWVMSVNTFFSTYVRIQKERGHQVITTGPYTIIRHPGYLAHAFVLSGTPLLLDSLLAYLAVFLVFVVVVIRTKLEDKVLFDELPGYKDYCMKVRYRLIPGIW